MAPRLCVYIVVKTRIKRSPIWFIPTDDLRHIAQQAKSLADILRACGLVAEGYYHSTLKKRLDADHIDYSHIKLGFGHNKGRTTFKTKALPKERAIQEVFIEHSPWSRNAIKAYLKRYNLIPYQCECGLEKEWAGKKLSLQLDHRNGKREDHRLDNLRWMCPNCHSQTDTFSGKANKRKPPRPSDIDPNYRHRPRPNQRKVSRPSKEELSKMVWEAPSSLIAMRYGIADTVIGKWCRIYGIKKPPRGYWNRRKAGASHEQALLPLPTTGPLPVTSLTVIQAEEVRRRYALGEESQRMLAKVFNTSRATIESILKNPNYGNQWGRNHTVLSLDVNG